MPENYIQIMIQSLRKKEQILDEIIALCREQAEVLEDPELTPEQFEKSVEKKAACIDRLNELDDGFEMLYERVSEELKTNREQYASQIRTMQDHIRRITEKSVEVEAAEARNKRQVEEKFSTIRRQVKQIRSSQKMVKEYYRSMQKINYIDPQFMDNKK